MRGGLIVFAALMALAGCADLPEAGPRTNAVETGASTGANTNGGSGYALVPLTAQVADALDRSDATQDSAGTFAMIPPAQALGRIAPGDALQCTFWEASPSGTTLLTPPGLMTALQVDQGGAVLMPYIGTMHVAGETTMQLQRRVVGALQAQGHVIQAVVLDTAPRGDIAVLSGAVARPGVVPLVAGTDTLLGLIANGGGPRDADDETLVRLARGGVRAAVPLSAIEADPALDIPLAPGDRVTLVPRRRDFYAFGAVNHPGAFAYDAPRISLIQALAQVAGLQDGLAAPRGVFIFRRAAGQTVYQLDLSQPIAFFIADSFAVQPDDVIYVSDAPVADVAKVLQTISGAGSIAGIPRNFGAPY